MLRPQPCLSVALGACEMLPVNKVSHGRIPKAFVAKAWWRGSSQRQQTQSTASHYNSADPPIVSQHTLHTREGKRRNKAKLMKSFEWLLFSEHTHTLKPKNCPRRTHAGIPHFQLIIAIETLICCCYLHICHIKWGGIAVVLLQRPGGGTSYSLSPCIM